MIGCARSAEARGAAFTRRIARRRAWIAFALPLLASGQAHAGPWRGLEQPSSERPAQVARGGGLELRVHVGSALTPPPGVQTERALRGFAARLCADGVPIAAPARMCLPLVVRNVRPRDAQSLVYRMQMRVPDALAEGRYDLDVRFPGGSDRAAGAVWVGPPTASPAELSEAPDANRVHVRAPSDRPARARLHLGDAGIAVEGARVEYYPRFRDDGTLAPGSVALVDVRPAASARIMRVPASDRREPHTLPGRRVEAGGALDFTLPVAGARVFWWFSPDQSTGGAHTRTRFLAPGPASVEALAIDGHGQSARYRLAVQVRPRVPAGCALARSAPGAWQGLLLAVVSWKLAAWRRGRWRRRNSARGPSVSRGP